jgi:hypothetical protein
MRSRFFPATGLLVAVWLCMLASLGVVRAASRPPIGPGWWVVLQLFPANGADRPDPARIRSTAQRCGQYTIFNEPSGAFNEFQPGYNIFVIGSFASSRKAEQVKDSLTRCFPNVFVKYGEYVGK